MSMTRFATICDAPKCTARSEEYTSWPVCRGCMGNICPAHTTDGSLIESERGNTVVCLACAEEGEL